MPGALHAAGHAVIFLGVSEQTDDMYDVGQVPGGGGAEYLQAEATWSDVLVNTATFMSQAQQGPLRGSLNMSRHWTYLL